MTRYQSSAHCVGESNWHLQFTPGYRRPIFEDQLTRELTTAYLMEAAEELHLHVGAIECGPDHIHLFLQETRKFSVVQVVQKLKGYSSYKMRKHHYALFSHYLYGDKFWSAGCCRRIGRNPAQEKLRKVSVICTTNQKKVLDVVITAKEQHGMRQIKKMNHHAFNKRTILADKEFDAESFRQLVEDAGGKAVVPVRWEGMPVWKTKGWHRKQMRRKGLPKIYRKRAVIESNNSAVKRRFSPVLRGMSFQQQKRDVHGKHLAYNLARDCTPCRQNFLQSLAH